jgi:hypothetical protein
MDMISRREIYWAQRERQPEKRLSKKQRRKLEKKLKAQEAAKSDQADSKSDKENEDSDEELPHKKPSALRSRNDNGEFILQRYLRSSIDLVKVVCAHSDEPLLSVDQVLDPPNRAYATPRGQDIRLPFVNQNCRIRVRVVDFWPSQLEEFSRRISEDVDATAQDDSQAYLTGSSPPPKWEWVFGLLVEDAGAPPPGQKPAKMSIIVSGKDAEYLLKLNATE